VSHFAGSSGSRKYLVQISADECLALPR